MMNTTLNLFYKETLGERIDDLLSHCQLGYQKKRIIRYLTAHPGACTDEIMAACEAIDPCRRIRELNAKDLQDYGLTIQGRIIPPTRLGKFGQHKRAYSWRIMRLEDA